MTEHLEPVNPDTPADPASAVPADPQAPPAEPQKPFTEQQEQYIGSWLGRIVKKQIDESVLPHIQQQQSVTQPPVDGNAMKQFNERLQEKIFAGDVTGAFQDFMAVQDQAKQNITKTQKVQTDRAITSYSDKPYYKDIYQDMEKIARDTVAQGFPPEAAALFAYNTAKGNYLETKISGGGSDDREGSLDMLPGGKRQQVKKTAKLPAQFKAAYERDKKRGLFKDEQDYINNLSPAIRQKYGI